MTHTPEKDAPPQRCNSAGAHRFGSYGVTSTLPLPALPASDEAIREHIHIESHDIPMPEAAILRHVWLEASATVLSLAAHEGMFWLKVPGIAEFRVQASPHRISVYMEGDEPDPATLEHQLVDQILPRLLDHLGELMVHASAVRIDGRHALFLGPSGAGKSTLAGLLQLRGHNVLSDDCVQLITTGDGWSALPTYPSLRLMSDSIDALYPEVSDATPVSEYSDKRRLPMMDLHQEAIPNEVDALYVLGEAIAGQQDVEIVAISPVEACLALIRHSFRMDIGNHVATARHLARCSAVARSMPAFQLNYPRDYGCHDAIADAIRRHLAALTSPLPAIADNIRQ